MTLRRFRKGTTLGSKLRSRSSCCSWTWRTTLRTSASSTASNDSPCRVQGSCVGARDMIRVCLLACPLLERVVVLVVGEQRREVEHGAALGETLVQTEEVLSDAHQRLEPLVDLTLQRQADAPARFELGRGFGQARAMGPKQRSDDGFAVRIRQLSTITASRVTGPPLPFDGQSKSHPASRWLLPNCDACSSSLVPTSAPDPNALLVDDPELAGCVFHGCELDASERQVAHSGE